ncbi:MAG: ABC transporter ATP-binding protein [Canibacter sp.]
MTALLRLSEITIRYPERTDPVVQHFSGEIKPGECVVLVGPSGAGKSTVLAAASGIIPHSIPAEMNGVVEVCGTVTSLMSVPEISNSVGTVFQDPDAQIVTGRVLDEVCFALENQLLDTKTVERRARAALTHFGLSEIEEHHPGILSGGQRQRLVLACVTAMSPQLLVLDEPTANLDPEAAADFYEMLSQRDHQGVLLVEHNLDLALSIANRIWELDATGKLVRNEPVTRPTFVSRTNRNGVNSKIDAEIEASIPSPGMSSFDLNRASGSLMLNQVTWKPNRKAIPVLKELSLRAQCGEVTALTGENGAGKSTVLRLMARLIRPSSGSVSWQPDDGRVAGTTPTLGFVFQNPEHQFLGQSVRGELRHVLSLRGLPRRQIRLEVDALLERFGLSGYADRNPFLLSGGQKRRLSVAIAFAGRPELLLLDEPSYGQDPNNLTLLLSEIRTAADSGATVVVSTHDPELLVQCADATILIRNGQAHPVKHQLTEPPMS